MNPSSKHGFIAGVFILPRIAVNQEFQVIKIYLDQLSTWTFCPLCLFLSADSESHYSIRAVSGKAEDKLMGMVGEDINMLGRLVEVAQANDDTTAIFYRPADRPSEQVLASIPRWEVPQTEVRAPVGESLVSASAPSSGNSGDPASSPSEQATTASVEESDSLDNTEIRDDVLHWFVKGLTFNGRHYGLIAMLSGRGGYPPPGHEHQVTGMMNSAEAWLKEFASREIARQKQLKEKGEAEQNRSRPNQDAPQQNSAQKNSAQKNDDEDDTQSSAASLDSEREDLLRSLVGHANYVELSYNVVNQLKQYLGADRVTWVDHAHNRFQVMAVSGQPSFNRRGNLIRQMQSLAKAVAPAGSHIWSNDSAIPPQLETPFERFLEEARSRVAGVFPINHQPLPPNPTDVQTLTEIVNQGHPELQRGVAVLLVESMEQEIDQLSVEQLLLQIKAPLAAAGYTAKKHYQLPLMPLWLRIAWFLELFRGKTKRKAYAITAAIVIALLALILIPAEFRVRCEGKLEPRVVRHIFEPGKTRIVRVLVEDGQQVTAGQRLIETEPTDLLIQLNEAETEYATAKADRSKFQYDEATVYRDRDRSREERVELRGRLEQAISKEKYALRKLEMLRDEVERTRYICAPIAGKVFAWNVQEKLSYRPIDVGARLFSIAEDETDLILRLRLPDQRIGYVTDRHAKNKKENRETLVYYKAASDASSRRLAKITSLATNSDLDEKTGAYLPIEATPIDSDEQLSSLRPGTSVDAKIACGTAPLGYCKLYEFFDWASRTWFRYIF